MHQFDKFSETDSMSVLVNNNFRVLLVMSRFGIGLGFGDSNIGEVCRKSGVDVKTFLAVVNLLLDENSAEHPEEDISVASVLTYLHHSHEYFLGFRLPEIRNKLIQTVGQKDDLSKAIISYFDEYIDEVHKHMKYEEDVVFPYVRKLLNGKKAAGYHIDVFERRHNHVEARLTEFKDILIRFYPSRSTNELNSVLFDIFSCEKDLASHNEVEDKILVPTVAKLESFRNLGNE